MHRSKQSLKLMMAIGLGVLLLLPLTVWATNLLTNSGLEAPFVKFDEYVGPGGIVWDQQVAHGWTHFTIDAPNRLRFFSASDWAAFNNSPVVERRDGEEAQVWWTPEENDAGIYQQISGLSIGETYGFQAGILQVFETTNRTDPASGKLLRSVGLDPTGGVDPTAATVIWGPEEGTATYTDPNTGDKFTWFYPGVGATALSTTVTVFARVRFTEEAGLFQTNQVWVDDTFMDVAPTTTLTLTAVGPTAVLASWSGAPRDGFELFAYEAQYRRAGDEAWTDLQIFTVQTDPSTNAARTFSVETGVEYIVRARTWHEQIGGEEHEVPGPWVEGSIIAGGVVSGAVLDNRAASVAGATVSAKDTMTVTTSQPGGQYDLVTGGGAFAITATHAAGWHTLDPISVTLTLTQVVPLSLTLSPPDNFIANGGLEGTLDGWTQDLMGTMPQASFDESDRRSGRYSLRIFGSGSLSQTGVVSGMYRPVLSFWHKVEKGNGDDTLVVQIAGDSVSQPGGSQSVVLPATQPLTITQTTAGWQHVALPLALTGTDIYSGNLSLQFSVDRAGMTPTIFYLDEISFGRSWGGPNRVYLPLILKN